MKQNKQTPANKLAFKTETLRKLVDSMSPEQLAQVVGGQMEPTTSQRSVTVAVGC